MTTDRPKGQLLATLYESGPPRTPRFVSSGKARRWSHIRHVMDLVLWTILVRFYNLFLDFENLVFWSVSGEASKYHQIKLFPVRILDISEVCTSERSSSRPAGTLPYYNHHPKKIWCRQLCGTCFWAFTVFLVFLECFGWCMNIWMINPLIDPESITCPYTFIYSYVFGCSGKLMSRTGKPPFYS